MIVISHPFGNQNVRQALAALSGADLLDRFHTTVYWDSTWPINSFLPRDVRSELNRRAYPEVKRTQVSISPIRETGRLLSRKLGLKPPYSLSAKVISEQVDNATARYVGRFNPPVVYAYDGVALETFKAARSQGSVRIYDLPHGYWRYDKQLLEEEAQLRPDYAGTIESYRDTAHFEKKDLELSLADHIIVPSAHVRRTLEHSPAADRTKYIVPYGTNDSDFPVRNSRRSNAARLRVLFVGQLTQRKGIAYLFDAITTMESAVELTIIGGKTGPSTALDRVIQKHRWIPTIPNQQILEEMARHDVLVLPSLTEAFGLVIGEALSRGLPVITTTATGGPELIRDGQDGFFVPIRSAEAIAEKLELLNRDRKLLDYMSVSALNRARDFTWERYRSLLIATLRQVLER